MQTEAKSLADYARAAYEHKQTFLTGPQVQARYQKSHVTIWRWVRGTELNFPQPIQINRLNYWKLSDLEAWEASQGGRANGQ